MKIIKNIHAPHWYHLSGITDYEVKDNKWKKIYKILITVSENEELSFGKARKFNGLYNIEYNHEDNDNFNIW